LATLKTGYDERYGRVAPGLLLREWILERCCNDPRVKRLNMLSSVKWHRDWQPDVIPLYCAYLALDRLSGPPLVNLLRMRFRYGPLIKGWLRRLESGARALRGLRRP
jgi:hypothetical protein